MDSSDKPVTEADFHLARSRMLDAFSRLEREISELLLRNTKCLSDGASLGQKAEALRKVPASPTYSKARRDKVQKLLDDLEPLLKYRADIVHSIMRTFEIDSHLVGCFINSRVDYSLPMPALIVDLSQMNRISGGVAALAREFSKP